MRAILALYQNHENGLMEVQAPASGGASSARPSGKDGSSACDSQVRRFRRKRSTAGYHTTAIFKEECSPQPDWDKLIIQNFEPDESSSKQHQGERTMPPKVSSK